MVTSRPVRLSSAAAATIAVRVRSFWFTRPALTGPAVVGPPAVGPAVVGPALPSPAATSRATTGPPCPSEPGPAHPHGPSSTLANLDALMQVNSHKERLE